MIDEQLRVRGITDVRVLEAMGRIPREEFVSGQAQGSAYADHPLSIGCDQTISQPYIVALMTEHLDLKGQEKVLEIGTGSGYQTAILGELAAQVVSVERSAQLAAQAQLRLEGLGYRNLKINVGDGTLGWPAEAPFDRVMITAASPCVPLPLVEQMRDDALMVLPLADAFGQMLTVVEKKQGVLESRAVCACVFVPLVGKYGYNR